MGDTRALNVTITTRTLLIAMLVVGFGFVVSSILDALLLVFLGIFLGLVFERPTLALMARTKLGRGLAGTIVVIGSAILVTILLLLLLSPLVQSVISMLQDLPDIVAGIQDDLPSDVADSGGSQAATDAAKTIASAIPNAVSSALGLAGNFFSAALAIFTLIFVALFFISDAPRLKGALTSILPAGESERASELWDRISNTISHWAIGALTIACIAGTVQGGTAWLLGSSYALALGLIAGFLDLIPNIGATIAGFILTLVIYSEEGLTAAIIMLVVVLVYQQIENNILSPTIYGKAVNISGFFVISGVTIFGALLGVVGALIAVPVTASVQIILIEYTKDRRERLAAERDAAAAQLVP